MKLKQLINFETQFNDVEINGVTCDSRKVQSGFAYVCIAGSTVDGHSFAQSAVENGAAVVIAEKDTGVSNQIIVDDTHAVFAIMSSNWFGNPSKSLKLIGVTGTNGKTSITYLLKSILESVGNKVGLIGTIHNMVGDRVIETQNTTPDAYELNRLFAEMRDEGCKYAVMECSSHALDQKRVYGIDFEAAVFTNLTQDHLDYHITMENYLEAKKKLFSMCKTAVINYDDKYAESLVNGLNCEVVTYSAESNHSTYSANGIKYRADGIEYELVGFGVIKRISYLTGGKFSVYNSMAAAITALKLGISLDEIAKALSEIKGVKGRAEVVPTGRDYTVIIDYAHTPDGLENILSTFKECEKNRLITVFGCGGDRDRTKRPIMGAVAAKNSDMVVVTSDNPRTEDPEKIIEDILVGLKNTKTPYFVEIDRTKAIEYALKQAKKGDIIVLAGKGHETYQILNTGKIHYDEREVVAQILENI